MPSSFRKQLKSTEGKKKKKKKRVTRQLRTQKDMEKRKLTDCHSQNKKGLFLDKVTLFKASTAQNILGSYKIIDMACSLHMPVDCLYEQIPEDWFWLQTK